MSEKTTQAKSHDETLRELQELLDMCATPGWKKWIDINKKQLASDKEVAHLVCDTHDKWERHRGHVSLMERILRLEEDVRAAYDSVIEQIESEKEFALEQDNGETYPI